MPDVDLKAPNLYVNRELTWLEFNHRVLDQSRLEDVPLLERLKFVSIVSSNLDEFFMIRVAGLKQVAESGREKRDVSGMTPDEQLDAIAERAHRMVAAQTASLREIVGRLDAEGFHLNTDGRLTAEQGKFMDAYFDAELRPMLTPLAVGELDPFPQLPGLTLNLAVALRCGDDAVGDGVCIAVVPIPGNLPRFLTVPAESGLHVVPLERVVARNVHRLFTDYEVRAQVLFQLTRDGDVPIDTDSAGDLLKSIEQAVRERRRRSVVRLAVSAEPNEDVLGWLKSWTDVDERDVYEVDGLLAAADLMSLALRPGFDHLREPDWPPLPPRDTADAEGTIWEVLQERDVLLFHPYEAFDPVVELLDVAADDPNVLAIKQTLYRTSGDSPVIAALERAALNDKQVTVLVELKARFDEARNVNWARRLEDAGCHVIYGIAGYKTHAKLLLIVRREPHGVRRYVHLSTGNYNDRTAKVYSDIGLMTSDRDLAADAAAFCNLLTGYSQEVGWNKLAISPHGIRGRMEDLIEREIEMATVDEPGLVIAKVNSLEDPGIIRALYRASMAGVRILLNVRGICCLRPGVEGVSENIRVVSIIDRFLEHARIFYFRNGGHDEVYLSSADWMRRNLDRRLETLFPVQDPSLRKRVHGWLHTYFADNTRAWEMHADGHYERIPTTDPPIRAQEELYRMAEESAAAAQRRTLRFTPLTRPE